MSLFQKTQCNLPIVSPLIPLNLLHYQWINKKTPLTKKVPFCLWQVGHICCKRRDDWAPVGSWKGQGKGHIWQDKQKELESFSKSLFDNKEYLLINILLTILAQHVWVLFKKGFYVYAILEWMNSGCHSNKLDVFGISAVKLTSRLLQLCEKKKRKRISSHCGHLWCDGQLLWINYDITG